MLGGGGGGGEDILHMHYAMHVYCVYYTLVLVLNGRSYTAPLGASLHPLSYAAPLKVHLQERVSDDDEMKGI
jgi:hypothetical protein